MIEITKLSACAVINLAVSIIPLAYSSRVVDSTRREVDMDSEFDTEWQDMPDDFVSDITDEELEHVVEDLLAAEIYLDDIDLTDNV